MKYKILIGILGFLLMVGIVTASVTISFSGTIVPEIPDSDKDGVPDSDDLCNDTIDLDVNSDGCSAQQFCNQYEINYTRKGRMIYIGWYNYWGCFKQDFKDNEERKYPRDCKVVKNRRTKEIYCTARKGAD